MNIHMSSVKTIGALIFVSLLCATTSYAGPREINVACAVSPDGCFPGDGGFGFPITITQPGSYVFTGDINLGSGPGPANTNGILIRTVGGVTIDLRGFALTGPATCVGSGSSLVCSPSGTGLGIVVENGFSPRVRIRDGRISGFSAGGIAVGELAHLENLVVRENGSTGVSLDNHSIVSNSIIDRNHGNGISMDMSLGYRNASTGNFGHGFSVTDSLLADSSVEDSGGSGVAADRALISHVSSNDNNGVAGLLNTDQSLIIDSTSIANFGSGILCLSRGSLMRNTVRDNLDAGIEPGSASHFANTISNNSFPDIFPSAPSGDMGFNACSGVLCP